MSPVDRRAVLSATLAGVAATIPVAATAQTPREQSPLGGKVAFVTGAARGIGRATAVELARRGADVALLDIAEPQATGSATAYQLAGADDLREAERLVRAEGVRALPIVADVRDLAAMRAAGERTVAELGGIDIAVLNAGIWGTPDTVDEMDSNVWRDVIDINLIGAMNSAQGVLAGLRRSDGGRMVIISSVSAQTGGSADSIAYNASKWGVTGLMKSLALALGPDGVRVNAVAPGPVDTVLLRDGVLRGSRGLSSSEAQEQSVREGQPLPVGIMEPQAIADTVAFLAGPEAANISGTTIDVNAGSSANTSV
ncbi:SDR family oxidoreductase [Pacificimonas flava]|uniref:3-oxoacyl-[acyl-carrier protein] reductase n=1 Tax=Pacificimonas flava TaxID=1234595 RepID=M2U1G2_9SPHN|nr:SDR family oxidoreductase [Pacificimonas flava]EMD81673.1 3-oxoacyl-[acyl-carrier protein] reductase [Pacificimonas flava]MBB5281766.1 NAD(P)-dependent dehydrogenase (short-subunit alcohol dehydrogenase family) [Pacificimonas flava]